MHATRAALEEGILPGGGNLMSKGIIDPAKVVRAAGCCLDRRPADHDGGHGCRSVEEAARAFCFG
jgi:hypothetical protein